MTEQGTAYPASRTDYQHTHAIVDKREWLEALAEAEARIKQLEDEQVLLLEDLTEAKRRIEALETALAAVVYGGLVTAQYVTSAAEVLGIDVDLD